MHKFELINVLVGELLLAGNELIPQEVLKKFSRKNLLNEDCSNLRGLNPNTSLILEKQKLQNKLQGFQEGKDYSVSPAENGRQVYNIHSDELKKVFGSNLVYCKIETYDGENYHYRGRFEGYQNGDFHKKFFNNNPNVKRVEFEVVEEEIRNSEPEMTIGIEHPRPDERKREIEGAKVSCFNCGKLSPEEIRLDNTSAGRNSVQGDGNVRCNECNAKYIEQLQTKITEEKQQKDEQIANLSEQNENLNQQLAEERQAKEAAQAERNNIQKVEKLEKTQHELKEIDKLSQKISLNAEELKDLKEQLNSSRQEIQTIAAAAHTQPLIPTNQPQAEIKIVAPKKVPPKTINHTPYLIGGLALLLGSVLGIDDLPNLNKMLIGYQKKFGEPQVALLTDGSRILGLGDLGINDFQTKYALGMLERYQNEYLCFNDDIQGTGAVVLAGLINAIKKTKLLPTQQRLLLVGAGSASVGLITTDRGDKLTKHKIFFARKDNKGKQYQKLREIIKHVKPTALIGLSGKKGIFTPKILQLMAKYNQKPIIFALSNPQIKAECSFATAMKHTNNQVIFASGTDFPDYAALSEGKVYKNNQANNMYIFPGLELGVLLAGAKTITNAMIYTAAKKLAESLNENEKKNNQLYPSLTRIQTVSRQIAAVYPYQRKIRVCERKIADIDCQIAKKLEELAIVEEFNQNLAQEIKEKVEEKSTETKDKLKKNLNKLTPDSATSTEEITNLQKEIETLKEKNLRLLADLDNQRKNHLEEIKKIGEILEHSLNKKMIEKTLPLFDNYERAIQISQVYQDPKVEQFLAGFQMTLAEVQTDFFKKEGVEEIKINPQKDTYDSKLHHALEVEESNDYPEGTILQVFQKGYRLRQQVLRRAE
ncbi:306_t:CDS:10, partial [Entrophospora sp. SA101]